MARAKAPHEAAAPPPLPGELPPPPDADAPVDLLVVAGEHSGDEHAARLIAGLRQEQPHLRIAALGGQQLDQVAGPLLFDMTSFSVVGLFEVLKHYSFFKDLFAKVVTWIARYRPRHLLLVDYPGFNLRLAAEMRRRGWSRHGGGEMGVWYYISPQIWAWKQKRRFRMAKALDGLACIFPFEPEVYADTALEAVFVGHPFARLGFRNPISYCRDGPVLLLPGSRSQPVQRILPRLLEVYRAYCQCEGASARPAEIRVPASLLQLARDVVSTRTGTGAEAFSLPVLPFYGGGLIEAGATVTSSGTVSLLCALAGIPGALVYRAHPWTYALGKRVVRIHYLGIASIILGRLVYPEFLQDEAPALEVAHWLQHCLHHPEPRELIRKDANELHRKLAVSAHATPEHWLSERLRTTPCRQP